VPGPGRSCPVAYRYRPEDLAQPAAFEAHTLYVVGGLYGNTQALDAVLRRADEEPTPPEVVFNGDFHYLDAQPAAFASVAERVLARRATLGNVEYALFAQDAELGCGCDYPDYIADHVVVDSNAVVARLRDTAAEFPEHLTRLTQLRRHLTATLGGHRVGIVHGDLESLAGWRLALEALEPADPAAREQTGWSGTPTSPRDIADWCARADVDILCCTHTGLPYAQDIEHGTHRYLVANNGSAGLPNLAGRRHGVITRLSLDPSVPADALYGIQLAGARFDALPVRYDTQRWDQEFLDTWPLGTPGYRGYHARISDSTWLRPQQAARGNVQLTHLVEGASVAGIPEVLFVCVHNAGRSQMAAALLDHHAHGAVRVRSAGSTPAQEINPAVREAMDELGLDISREFPKKLTTDAVEAADVVITMGCGDSCPIFPGKRYLDWQLDDPAGKTLDQIRPIRDEIARRVRDLLTALTTPTKS
jgi:protein-tyrosine-phosphatase